MTKEILKITNIKNKEIIFAFNENAWATGEFVIDWLNKVWIEYLKNYDNMLGSLLIMNKATNSL